MCLEQVTLKNTLVPTIGYNQIEIDIIVCLMDTLSVIYGSLGNHEFDEEVDGLVPFIQNLTSPVLAANLILDKVPQLQNITNLYKSIVLTKGGVKIGIIGYLTPDTKFLAPKNNVDYEDEIPAIKREVTILREKSVNIIIALGHSGFLKDLEIAKEVDGLDLVIGGHSNTFLWNGENFSESPEQPQGFYPTIVKQASGKTVPVVQAYAYTKYLGKLHLIFDPSGKLLKCFGDPVLLQQDIPNDDQVMDIIKRYRKDIDRINNEVVGSSMTFLDGEQCRIRECNLGNIITDAILDYSEGIKVAVLQGGRIRASLGRPETPFNITRGDVITILPFSDTLTIVTMNGSMLLDALEHSVASWRTIDSPGQFLQMSGIEVVYDLAKEPGRRVQTARAVCDICTDLTEIRVDLTYKIIMPGFIAEGGDGYSNFDNLEKETLAYSEVTCVLNYLKKYSPINITPMGRIKILNEKTIIDSLSRTALNNEIHFSGAVSNKFNTLLVSLLLASSSLSLITNTFH